MRSLLYTTSRHTWRVSGRIPNASLLPTEAHCIGYDGTSYTPVVVRYIKRTDAFGTQSVSHTEAPTVRKIRHLNHWRCLINSSESCDFYTQAVGVTYWCGNSEWSLPPGSCDSQVLLSGSKKKKKVSHFFLTLRSKWREWREDHVTVLGQVTTQDRDRDVTHDAACFSLHPHVFQHVPPPSLWFDSDNVASISY